MIPKFLNVIYTSNSGYVYGYFVSSKLNHSTKQIEFIFLLYQDVMAFEFLVIYVCYVRHSFIHA